MNGCIDLLFRHNGQYYVLDWKTNFLGPSPDDYTDDAIGRSMLEALYPLQYHIYVVAAGMFLDRRVPGYDHGRDFGGVFYAYTRGMRSEKPAGHSVFFDKPDPELIRELTEVLTGARG